MQAIGIVMTLGNPLRRSKMKFYEYRLPEILGEITFLKDQRAAMLNERHEVAARQYVVKFLAETADNPYDRYELGGELTLLTERLRKLAEDYEVKTLAISLCEVKYRILKQQYVALVFPFWARLRYSRYRY